MLDHQLKNRIGVPHTRGDEPYDDKEDKRQNEVFPTPVGMNRIIGFVLVSFSGVPHTRGDEPLIHTKSLIKVTCSPHPWG